MTTPLHLTDPHTDCRHWQLTPAQCARYHGRLTRYHADRSVAFADKAVRAGRIALRLAYGGFALAAVSVILALFA